MMNSIAVLGCGLSGLMVTQALVDGGIDLDEIEIISDKIEKPEPKGFMMLHDNCGMVGLDKEHFPVIQEGSEREYKKKLNYTGDISASWKTGLKEYWMVGFNPYQAIDRLWDKYESKITQSKVKPENLDSLKNNYSQVISTIPPTALYNNIKTYSTKIWVEYSEINTNYNPGVVYNGRKDNWETRKTLLWGKKTVEFCKHLANTTEIIKPLRVEGIPDDNIIKVGRVGQWNKNILAHQVYYKIYGMTKKNLIKIS